MCDAWIEGSVLRILGVVHGRLVAVGGYRLEAFLRTLRIRRRGQAASTPFIVSGRDAMRVARDIDAEQLSRIGQRGRAEVTAQHGHISQPAEATEQQVA